MKTRSIDLKIGWCIWNIGLLVPVLIPLFLGRALSIFMPGFLSYCYGLLAVGFYLFDQHLRITTQEITYANTKKSFTILAMIGIIALYILYNPVDTSIETRLLLIISLIIFFIAFSLAYKLNVPLIKRQEVEEEERDQAIKELIRSRQETRDSAKRDASAIVKEELNEYHQD